MEPGQHRHLCSHVAVSLVVLFWRVTVDGSCDIISHGTEWGAMVGYSHGRGLKSCYALDSSLRWWCTSGHHSFIQEASGLDYGVIHGIVHKDIVCRKAVVKRMQCYILTAVLDFPTRVRWLGIEIVVHPPYSLNLVLWFLSWEIKRELQWCCLVLIIILDLIML